MNATKKGARTYAAAHFALELDGKKNVGFCRSIEGGGIKAEILTQKNGNEHRQWKQVSKPKYEDIKLQVGMSMSEVFYDWIENFFSGTVDRRDGAIVAGDFHYVERARREMYQMLISEIGMPALDGKDKNGACYMTVTITPEHVKFTPGSQERLDRSPMEPQKLWTPNNFMFRIKGFEQSCKRVSKIDGFTIKQQILEYPAGNLRDPLRVPGMLEIPNITFYLPESDSAPFFKHFEKHVQRGVPQVDPRLTGAIEFRDNAGNELCTIELMGVDIANVDPGKSDAESDEIKTVKVEITVEKMKFRYKKQRGG